MTWHQTVTVTFRLSPRFCRRVSAAFLKRDLASNIVMICNVKTGTAVLALVNLQLASKTTGKLIFHHVGSQYSLTEIWGGAGSQGMVLSAPRGNGA
jgi:hypothetical protein